MSETALLSQHHADISRGPSPNTKIYFSLPFIQFHSLTRTHTHTHVIGEYPSYHDIIETDVFTTPHCMKHNIIIMVLCLSKNDAIDCKSYEIHPEREIL